jgi:hypothetical protein
MSPVQVERVKSLSLRTKEDVPAAVDHFHAGTIDTDFFLDEVTENKPQQRRSVKKQMDSDDEWTGNPIVAADEDLEEMEYYGAEGDVTAKKAAAIEIDEEDDDNGDYQEPVKFKSSLLQVWDDPMAAPVVTSQGIVSQHNAAFAGSDSEDEVDTSYDGGVSGTAGEYEEIGGSDNPWSFEPVRPGASDFSSPPQVKSMRSTLNLKTWITNLSSIGWMGRERSLEIANRLRSHLRTTFLFGATQAVNHILPNLRVAMMLEKRALRLKTNQRNSRKRRRRIE